MTWGRPLTATEAHALLLPRVAVASGRNPTAAAAAKARTQTLENCILDLAERGRERRTRCGVGTGGNRAGRRLVG